MWRSELLQMSLCTWNPTLSTCTTSNSPQTNIICLPPSPPSLPPTAPPPALPPITPPRPPPGPPFSYFTDCFGSGAGPGALTMAQTLFGGTLQASGVNMRFYDSESAALVCRWWPRPPVEALACVWTNQGTCRLVTQAEVDNENVYNGVDCANILYYSGAYWLRYDKAQLGQAASTFNSFSAGTTYTPVTDLANCGTAPPPPSPPPPALPPSPPPPPWQPSSACRLMAEWYTGRRVITNEPRRDGNQCVNIARWFCAVGAGKGSHTGVRVHHVYCRDSTGNIVYCRESDDETPDKSNNCASEANAGGCTGFTPECSTGMNQPVATENNRQWLNCDDNAMNGNGVNPALLPPDPVTGAARTTYVDEHGRPNCLHKYGLLYEDFVKAALGTFRHGDAGSEETFTRMRACYMDTGIDPYRALYENSIQSSYHPGILMQCSLCAPTNTECLELCVKGMQRPNMLPPYSEGFRENINHRFIDSEGFTGIARDKCALQTLEPISHSPLLTRLHFLQLGRRNELLHDAALLAVHQPDAQQRLREGNVAPVRVRSRVQPDARDGRRPAGREHLPRRIRRAARAAERSTQPAAQPDPEPARPAAAAGAEPPTLADGPRARRVARERRLLLPAEPAAPATAHVYAAAARADRLEGTEVRRVVCWGACAFLIKRIPPRVVVRRVRARGRRVGVGRLAAAVLLLLEALLLGLLPLVLLLVAPLLGLLLCALGGAARLAPLLAAALAALGGLLGLLGGLGRLLGVLAHLARLLGRLAQQLGALHQDAQLAAHVGGIRIGILIPLLQAVVQEPGGEHGIDPAGRRGEPAAGLCQPCGTEAHRQQLS
jgi:hypothetical protein